MTATESEQVRILRENELLRAENERLEAAAVQADQALQAAHAISLDALRLQEQAEAREARLEEAIAHALHRRKNHGEVLSCSTLEAALAEGDGDGELKPEEEARLRESLKTPREDLLTSDQMRQKLEDDDVECRCSSR